MSNNKIGQIRFYGNNDNRNTVSFENLVNSYILYPEEEANTLPYKTYPSLKELQIKTLPGTIITFKYKLNENSESESFTIIVDHSGVYNLECNNFILTEFSINSKSLEIIRDNNFGYFIGNIIF